MDKNKKEILPEQLELEENSGQPEIIGSDEALLDEDYDEEYEGEYEGEYDGAEYDESSEEQNTEE